MKTCDLCGSNRIDRVNAAPARADEPGHGPGYECRNCGLFMTADFWDEVDRDAQRADVKMDYD